MSAEENVKIRKKNRWTQAMLEHLIKVWGKYYHELKMNSRGHDKIYAKIIEELAMVGCTASLEDVRGRIHNLSGKYRKEAAAEVATGRRSQWPYFYKIGRFFDYTVPAPVPTNARPVLYDMSQYLALEYAMEEESLDLEGNERILIQEGELSDEEHLEDGLDEEEDRSEADDWQSEHLEDYDNMEEDLADEAEEGPLVEVLPGEDGSSIAPFEPEKDPSEPDDGPLVPNNGPLVPNNGPLVPNNGPLVPNNGPIVPKKDDKVETPPTEERPSPGKQQPVTQKEKEKSVHTRDSDGGSQTQSPKGKVYHLNSVFRHETIDDFLRVLYSNRLYTDVTIITCHNGDICTIPAHQLVLANFSPYFSRIFENLKPASTGGSVALILPPDIPHSVMQILLEYMYTGGTDVPGEVIDDVVRCGSQLKIRGFWSEIKGEPTVKRPTQSSDDRTNKKARVDADDSSRSSTPSSPEYERISPRKPTRNKPDDDEVALTDVSSDIGLDLLRSDLDDEENDGDEDDDDDDDDEEDEDEDGTDDDEDDYDDDENEDDEDDKTNDNEHDDDDDDEEDEDDDDDDDEDDDEDDGDDDDGEEEHRIIKQERHKQKLKLKIPYNIIKQTTEKRIKEEDRICPKRRLDTTKFNGESNSEHSESRTKRKCDTQATTSAASTRDQSPAEKSLHHAATDGTSKKGNLMKLWGNNVLNCRICSQRFTSVNEWLDHVVEMHGSEPCLLGKRTTENHITMLQCDLCQTYQESERGWLRHVLLRHAE